MSKKTGILPEDSARRRVEQASQLGELTGWAPGPAELGDFLHRIRVFPPDVADWRKRLVRRIKETPDEFPGLPVELDAGEIRSKVDEYTTWIREVANILAVKYRTPDLGNKQDPVDELVYIILARKTREEAYQATFDALKKRFSSWDALLRARPSTVEKLVHQGGLSGKKTQSLFGALKAVKERFGSCSLEGAMEWPDKELEEFLCSLPEVSRKSAYCVMMYSMGRQVFPVDTHVGRILDRLGVLELLGIDLEGTDHKKKQMILEDLIPPPLRYSLHVNLVVHGREACRAQSPSCEGCVTRKLCRTYRREQVQITADRGGYTVGDFFCGSGGMSTGFVQQGFRPVFAVDSDPAACRTYRLNHPMVPDEAVICKDVRYLCLDELTARAGSSTVDVLVGGPPCQGFSLVGHKTKGTRYRETNLLEFLKRRDSRNYLYELMMGAAIALRPRMVLMENVPAMTSSRQGSKSFMDQAADMLKEAGYATAIWKLEASAYGVPQRRRRAFLVASADGRIPAQPFTEYQDISKRHIDPDALEPVTVDSAIYDLPPLEADEGFQVSPMNLDSDPRARFYLDNPAFRMRNESGLVFNHRARYNNEDDLELFGLLEPGENGRDVLEKYKRHDLMRYRTDVFDDKYSRLRPDQPCRTVVAHLSRDGNSFIHPSQVRTITVREGARLQSYPDDFMFCGSPSDQWTQVGNSVPPVLAASLARTLLDHLKGFSS
jgi:DNA (cytosine-5)-methyltransferase 1